VMSLRHPTGMVFVLKVPFHLFLIRKLMLLSSQPQFLSNSDVSVPLQGGWFGLVLTALITSTNTVSTERGDLLHGYDILIYSQQWLK